MSLKHSEKDEEDPQYSSLYESVSASDAVHPMFKGYRERQKDEFTSTGQDLYYRCMECDEYFPADGHAILIHFTQRTHMPVDSCVYCQGPVCDYFHNSQRFIYHSCGPPEPPRTTHSKSLISSVRSKFSMRNAGCGVS